MNAVENITHASSNDSNVMELDGKGEDLQSQCQKCEKFVDRSFIAC